MIQRRTPLKRSTKPIKRSPLRRTALPLKRRVAKSSTPKRRKVSTPEKLLKKKLWQLCKVIIRAKYGNDCYTCGKSGLVGSNWHTGHFIPSATCGLYLRYDLRNLRPQCFDCNINLGGNGSAFYRRLMADEGSDYVERLFEDKQRITPSGKLFILDKISEYTEIATKYTIPQLSTVEV